MSCDSGYIASAGASSPAESYADSVGDYSAPSDCDNEILCWIRQHPIASIGIALAIGLLLGRR